MAEQELDLFEFAAGNMAESGAGATQIVGRNLLDPDTSQNPERRIRPPFRLRHLPRRLPTTLAAIPLARLPGMKTLLASLQQTTAHPRPTLPPASLLIF